jgi:hypothetical protein
MSPLLLHSSILDREEEEAWGGNGAKRKDLAFLSWRRGRQKSTASWKKKKNSL